MKNTITFDAKCRQCMHFEILDEKDEDECSNLQLDEKTLKNVLRDFGIFNVRIV